jgi:predicted Rossmann fold nucleotide-binding protein DprA/Smf involved in DNA uptake
MSFQAMTWAWQQKVSPTQKLVLLALADRADEFRNCEASLTRLISETGLTLEQIGRAMAKLEIQGLVISTPDIKFQWIRCQLMIEVK